MEGENEKRFLVILADRQRGRFFTIFLNTFEDQGEEFFDNVPQKVKAEHTRPGKVQSHIKDHLHRHFKNVGERAKEFLIKRRVTHLQGVIVGGHKELFKEMEKFLPTGLKNKVIGEFVTDLHLPVGDLTQKALRILK